MSTGEGSPTSGVMPTPESKPLESNSSKEEPTSLKRKFLSVSPAPPGNSASNKRVKLEDSPGRIDVLPDSEAPRDVDLSKNGAVTVPESSADSKKEDPPLVRDHRGKVSQEEKKRGRRLFGGLLGTLSQTTTTSSVKKRQEIERRQQEKVQRQKIEDDKCRMQRLSKLGTIRKVEQVKLDEQVMRTRHSNLLATARNLKTMSEPRLHYRPWELSTAQQDTISKQVRDTEFLIEDEVQRFKHHKDQTLKEMGVSTPSNTVGGDLVEEQSNTAQSGITNHDSNHLPLKLKHDKDHDDNVFNGDIIEEEEDTVIY